VRQAAYARRAAALGRSARRRRRASGEHREHGQQRDRASRPIHAVILARDQVYIASRFMSRAFARCSLVDAVGRLRPAMTVLMPPGCGEPAALVGEICRQSARLPDLTLLGGIHLGDYPFARPEHAALRFATWHMSPRLADAFLHRSQVDCWVEADEPLTPYPPPPIGEVERAIGRHVAGLVPDGATVQIGVGAIPQAVLEALANHRDLALHSLLVDASVALVGRGAVTNARQRVHRG